MKISLLSIVIPIYNEQNILQELVERCVSSGETTGCPFEILLVDDASDDQTPLIIQDLAMDSRIQVVRLQVNQGQFRATREGLRHTRGDWIVVLDGDLQDPPEKIVDLVQALDLEFDYRTVVFAVKKKREEPFWFLLGSTIYKFILFLIGVSLPNGAGSYCLFSRSMALKVVDTPFPIVNLAALLVALKVHIRTIPYVKGRRYDNRSRVGKIGLIYEALVSIFILSSIGRYLLRIRKSCEC